MQKVKKYIEKTVTMENQVTTTKVTMGMVMMETATTIKVNMGTENNFQWMRLND